MEIERVNDSTIKFFITYKDIEARGFDRDEIWYNRERGEELFFDMISEAHDREEFELEGPLWIQVQALDRGLEIIVTKGQITDGNVKLEIPITKSKGNELPVEESIAKLFDEQFVSHFSDELDDQLELVIGFSDFEDLISLSHTFTGNEFENTLYFFEGKYYLYVAFNDAEYDDDEQDDMLSRILEFGFESEVSIHRIEEYGKKIMDSSAIKMIREHFSLK